MDNQRVYSNLTSFLLSPKSATAKVFACLQEIKMLTQKTRNKTTTTTLGCDKDKRLLLRLFSILLPVPRGEWRNFREIFKTKKAKSAHNNSKYFFPSPLCFSCSVSSLFSHVHNLSVNIFTAFRCLFKAPSQKRFPRDAERTISKNSKTQHLTWEQKQQKTVFPNIYLHVLCRGGTHKTLKSFADVLKILNGDFMSINIV